ncbi:hypothetical protein Plhal703r1_c28g0113861 [Plasmopara halstedii]
MRRLSLTAMPSRRHKSRASLNSTADKSANNLRSTFGNFGMYSSSVATSASSESLTSLSTASSSYGGLMEDFDDKGGEYEDEQCYEQGWVYWKQRDDCWLKILQLQALTQQTLAVLSPVVPLAKAWSFLPMNASLTQSYKRSVAAEQTDTEISPRKIKEVEQVYTGTLVIYNKEQKKSPWKQLLSTKRLRDACRQRLEKLVDRLDTSKR